MGRQVITARDLEPEAGGSPGALMDMGPMGGPAPTTPTSPDGAMDRIVKYVPSEVLAVYLPVASAMEEGIDPVWTWVLFGIVLILTPIYLARVAKVNKKKQLILSTVCFLVWVMALGMQPFNDLGNSPLIAALIPVFTFTLPMWDPPASD